jgi:Mg-chelatase subunit ChlD
MRYHTRRGTVRIGRLGVSACLALVVLTCACEAPRRPEPSGRRNAGDEESAAPYQADIDEGLGAAVAILVDTSGSMRDNAAGDTRPKYVVAQEALEAMLDATDAFIARRPEFPIKIGIYSFSSSVRILRPIQPYDRGAIRLALAGLPRPGGGTAIGEALREARPDLYRAGVFRKYLLVVTDGENTSGRSPDTVAREIFRKSEGAVQVYFVAFDTRPEKFAFLKDVGGDVIEAGTGDELRKALDGIYQGKILAEAPGAGEREPVKK